MTKLLLTGALLIVYSAFLFISILAFSMVLELKKNYYKSSLYEWDLDDECECEGDCDEDC